MGDKIYEDDRLFKEYLEGKKMGRMMLHLRKVSVNGRLIESEIPKELIGMIFKSENNSLADENTFQRC